MSKWGKWAGGLVIWTENKTAYISVAFSWKLPEARKLAIWYKQQGYHVRAGGPGTFVRDDYLADIAEVGGDVAALVRHNPNATFASRGCPVGCSFCIVPAYEGREFTLLWNFIPRPLLCDSNLSALPVEFQEHIIKRYQDTDVPLKDAISGFEPRTFDDACFRRWKRINKGPWRFGLDEMKELKYARQMLKIIKHEKYWKKRAYILIGNEPIEQCYERTIKIIKWGGEPYCQPVMALNALKRKPIIRHDWTEQLLRDFARWANRWLWRSIPLKEYKPRKNEPPPFENLI